MPIAKVPVSKFDEPSMGPLPRRSPELFLVAAFVLLSPPLRLWGFCGPAPLRARPFPVPVPLFLSSVFVLAATLVANLAALVLEVSFVSYVSESSWETAFSDDKFVTGVATWFETESGDNELVLSGCVYQQRFAVSEVCSFPSWRVFFERKQLEKRLIFWSTCWRVARPSVL